MRSNRILLVEDNPDDVELVLTAVRRQKIPCEVTVAADGLAALAYLSRARDAELPSVVFLDLKMPKIDGLTLLARLRSDERTRLMPVIMFTSSNAERDVIASYDRGCNGYVYKPIDFEELCEAVRDVTRYWLRWNEPPTVGVHLPSSGMPDTPEPPAAVAD